MQCDEDDVVLSNCDTNVILDNALYDSAESAFYTVISAEVDGDCLLVNISSSGCDGNTWVFTLIDSEDVAESMPPQRFLKLELENNEACLAVFSKEQSFDLSALRVDDANEVILNIEGFPEPLNYNY